MNKSAIGHYISPAHSVLSNQCWLLEYVGTLLTKGMVLPNYQFIHTFPKGITQEQHNASTIISSVRFLQSFFSVYYLSVVSPCYNNLSACLCNLRSPCTWNKSNHNNNTLLAAYKPTFVATGIFRSIWQMCSHWGMATEYEQGLTNAITFSSAPVLPVQRLSYSPPHIQLEKRKHSVMQSSKAKSGLN